MIPSLSQPLNRPATRRLKRSTVIRRCVGSMIMLAGAYIITSDMIAFAASGLGTSAPSLITLGSMRAAK